MSGVIDDDGQQWEHCCKCHNFVRIQDLVYFTRLDTDPEEHCGYDLCWRCRIEFKKANGVPQAKFQGGLLVYI